MQYKKPMLERFGTFRELTQVGWASINDGGTMLGARYGCTEYNEQGGYFVGGCIATS
jgi:hypothetical protein